MAADFYAVLEITQTASSEEIRAAYRRLARTLIPAWWWKAGAGVGAAAVVGVVGLAMVGGGEAPAAPEDDDLSLCIPADVTVESR